MAQIFPSRFQVFNSAGKPLSGGKFFTYVAGTSTKKLTYSDPGLTIPNTNPVILDARGEAAIFGSGTYKFILSPSTDTDPPANSIWTQDDIVVSVLSALTDTDLDTRIQLEESADEDIIRFDVGGTEKVTISSTGLNVDDITEKTAAAGVTIDSVVLKDDTVTADTIITDTINEKTTDAGVTIDGSLIKDGDIKVDTITEKTATSGVTIDGFLIKDGAIPAESVTTSQLKTSMSEVSQSGSGANETLPGGEYGFYPQIKVGSGDDLSIKISNEITFTTYATNIYIGAAGGEIGYAQQRYVTASGEVFWVFILRNKQTKFISSVCAAPDHVCFGNGGKPNLVQHPFPDFDDTTDEIIVINPSKAEVDEMQKKRTVASEDIPDRCLIEVILEDYVLDETVEPPWPAIPVTVGLPPDWADKPMGASIQPIKKIIPKPNFIKTARLKLK